ncbi:MAG: PKD domain-containing protein [Bacteroidia bacterium]|nr:PKD domain-containing protein [Bacteroidia bacterium]
MGQNTSLRFFGLLFLAWLALFPNGQAQTIVFADFNTGIPATWTIVNGGTTNDTWFGTTNGYQGNTLNGSEFAFVNSDAAGSSSSIDLSEQLKTPVFNGNLYSQVILEFDQYYRDYSLDSGFVEVFNGSSWVTVLAISTNMGAWNAPDHRTINLTAYKNANMQVRFRYEDNTIWAWYWAVDNVFIHSPLAFDLSATAILAPISSCGLGAAEDVIFQVNNAGTSSVNSFVLHYRFNNGPIVNETVNTTLAPGGNYTHTFANKANLSVGTSFTFQAWATLSGDNNHANDSVTGYQVQSFPQVTNFPYSEGFETGTGNWFANGTNSTWAHGTPAKNVIQGAASGTKAWATGGTGTNQYVNNEASYLQSTCFDFSNLSNPWIKAAVWWDCERDWDGVVLQASTNFGTSWTTIGKKGDPGNWYNHDAINANPGGQAQGWSGWNQNSTGSGGWVTAWHPLTGLAGQPNVRLRFAFASDGSITADGFGLDDVYINDGPQLELGPDTSACDSLTLTAPNALSWAWSTGETTQSISLTDSSQMIYLTLTDANGFQALDSIFVQIITTSVLDLGPDTHFCAGSLTVLDGGSGAQSWTWSTGETTQVIGVSVDGTYWVHTDFGAGCIRSDTVTVGFGTAGAGFILPGDTVCKNTPLIFQDTTPNAVSWDWNFGDGGTSNQQMPAHTFLAGGTYLIKLSVSTAFCTENLQKTIFLENCLGLDDLISNNFQIYPNPASTQLQISSEPACGIIQIKFLDLNGRELMTQSPPDKGLEHELRLESIPVGNYVLQIFSDCGNYRRIIQVAR